MLADRFLEGNGSIPSGRNGTTVRPIAMRAAARESKAVIPDRLRERDPVHQEGNGASFEVRVKRLDRQQARPETSPAINASNVKIGAAPELGWVRVFAGWSLRFVYLPLSLSI